MVGGENIPSLLPRPSFPVGTCYKPPDEGEGCQSREYRLGCFVQWVSRHHNAKGGRRDKRAEEFLARCQDWIAPGDTRGKIDGIHDAVGRSSRSGGMPLRQEPDGGKTEVLEDCLAPEIVCWGIYLTVFYRPPVDFREESAEEDLIITQVGCVDDNVLHFRG